MSILDKLFNTVEKAVDPSGFYVELSNGKWMESLMQAVIGLTLISLTVIFTGVVKQFGMLDHLASLVVIALLSTLSVIAVGSAWLTGIAARELEQKAKEEFLMQYPEQRHIFRDRTKLQRLKSGLKNNPWIYAPVAITATYIVLELIW